MSVGMTEADASPASTSAGQCKTPISTFKALSTVSYADRIRPKKNNGASDMPAAPGDGAGAGSAAVTPPADGGGQRLGEPSTEPARPEAEGEAASASAQDKGKSKSNGAAELEAADDAGWQAVPTRSRTTKASTRKEAEGRTTDSGSRWGKKSAAGGGGGGDKAGDAQSSPGGRAGGRDGWSDPEKTETGAAALSSDSWRSSSNSRAAGGEQKRSESRGEGVSQTGKVPEDKTKAEASDVLAKGIDKTEPATPGTTEGTPDKSQAATAAEPESRTASGPPAKEEQSGVKPAAPPVNVWQARREEQRRAAASAAPSARPSSNLATAPSVGSAGQQPKPSNTTQQRSIAAGMSSQAQMPKPGQSYKATPTVRTAAPVTRDPTAWPEVQSSALKASNAGVTKGKDDAQSVVSTADAAPVKKEKTKWIPIPASQLDLTLDPPIRPKKAAAEPNARAKRAANGPPDRSEKGADSRQPKVPAKAGTKAKVPAAKPGAGSTAPVAPKKAKGDKAARDNDQASQSMEAPSQSNGLLQGERASLSSGSFVHSEMEEGLLSAEVVPNGLAEGVARRATSQSGDPRNSLAIDTGAGQAQDLLHSEAHARSPNAQSHFQGMTRGGIPFVRGQRGGQRGGRGGWRGNSSPSGNYTHGYRGRPSITSPGTRSTSLPVSGNVSPHLAATYSHLPDAQYGMSPGQGYSYPVPYYSYGAAGYPMYPQEPSSYEQQMLNSFATFGPPPPMPVSVVPGLDPLRVRVLGQLEYYFGEQNLPMDFFLRQQMDSRGWIDISMVASFNRVKSLSTDLDVIKEVLKLSSVVEVRDDKVRLANGKHKAWILPDAAPSRFEENAGSEASPPIYSGSGIITSDLPAETRDKIAGEVTRDVLKSGTSAVLDALSPPQLGNKQIPAPLKVLEEDEASESATGTDNNTGHLTPATSVGDEEAAKVKEA